MIYTADDEAMKEYSAIIQQIAYLDYQRNELINRLGEWEKDHGQNPDEQTEEEPAPEM